MRKSLCMRGTYNIYMNNWYMVYYGICVQTGVAGTIKHA